MKEPFLRYETPAGVEYEILSSDLVNYYTVPMIGLLASGCQCKFSHFNPTCKHQALAEREEKIYQGPKQPPEAVSAREKAPLHSANNTFSLLRKPVAKSQ